MLLKRSKQQSNSFVGYTEATLSFALLVPHRPSAISFGSGFLLGDMRQLQKAAAQLTSLSKLLQTNRMKSSARRWKLRTRREAALLWLPCISRESCMWLMLGTAGEP